MPLYDFECLSCKKHFERSLPMGSKTPPCPECNSSEIERKFAPPPVIFKGDGFYKTDSVVRPAPHNTKKEQEKVQPDQAKKEEKTPPEAPKPKDTLKD